MNRNRKILLLVVSACLFTMAIAGCSGDNTAKVLMWTSILWI